MRKFLSCLFALLLVVSLVACNNNTPPVTGSEESESVSESQSVQTPQTPEDPGTTPEDPDGGSSEEETPLTPIPTTPVAAIYPDIPTEDSATRIDLVVGGKAQYTVVSNSEEYDKLAQSMATQLTQKAGVTFTSKSSSQKDKVTGKKIMIGKPPKNVISNVSALAYNGLLSNATSSTINLTGHLPETVDLAVKRFLSVDFTPYTTTESNGKKISVPNNKITFIANPTNYVNASPMLLGTALSQYTIVVPEEMSATENFCVLRMIDEIGRYSGVYLTTKTASKATGTNEIVIGHTSLTTSEALYSNLENRTFVLKSEGSCVYIAYSDYTIAEQARYAFHELYLRDQSEAFNLAKTAKEEILVEKSEGTDIRVMTSNIVCAADANGIKDIQIPYGILWQERVAIVCREIMTYMPDFVGMQEIQNGTVNAIPADMFTEILNNVSSEYDFVTYEVIDKPVDYWNPILYRKTVWQIEAKDVLYPGNFDNAMHRWQWALFSKIDDPSQKYIVLNLHNPTRSGNLPGQLAAADIVNAKILELKQLYPNVPIILTGDFNTEFGTETYQRTIANTDVRCAYTQTENCYDLGDLTGTETSTTKDDVIDHIMVSTDLMDVLACRKINNDYMMLTSDHRPIFADLALK